MLIMDIKIIITLLLSAVLITSIAQALQLNSFKNKLAATSTGTGVGFGAMDTSGWSANEIMNYEMHGTIPAKYQSGAASASGSSGVGMVGGC